MIGCTVYQSNSRRIRGGEKSHKASVVSKVKERAGCFFRKGEAQQFIMH